MFGEIKETQGSLIPRIFKFSKKKKKTPQRILDL
jgi:hypothetical protein